MTSKFQGESSHKVDGKGRVALPVKFRRALTAGDRRVLNGDLPRLFIAYGNPASRDVECLSGDYYDELTDRIEAMPDGSAERELLEYLYYVKCDEVAVDDTGRFVLPPAVREKLGLTSDAVFQGKGRRFVILHPDDCVDRDREMTKLLEQLGDGKDFFNPISLANAAPAQAAGAADPAAGS